MSDRHRNERTPLLSRDSSDSIETSQERSQVRHQFWSRSWATTQYQTELTTRAGCRILRWRRGRSKTMVVPEEDHQCQHHLAHGIYVSPGLVYVQSRHQTNCRRPGQR